MLQRGLDKILNRKKHVSIWPFIDSINSVRYVVTVCSLSFHLQCGRKAQHNTIWSTPQLFWATTSMQLYIQQTRETRPFPEEKQAKPESVKVLAKEVSSNLVPPFLPIRLFTKNNRSIFASKKLLKPTYTVHTNDMKKDNHFGKRI